jgi:hypothetical protein
LRRYERRGEEDGREGDGREGERRETRTKEETERRVRGKRGGEEWRKV